MVGVFPYHHTNALSQLKCKTLVFNLVNTEHILLFHQQFGLHVTWEKHQQRKNRQQFKYICAFRRTDYAVVEEKRTKRSILKQLNISSSSKYHHGQRMYRTSHPWMRGKYNYLMKDQPFITTTTEKRIIFKFKQNYVHNLNNIWHNVLEAHG